MYETYISQEQAPDRSKLLKAPVDMKSHMSCGERQREDASVGKLGPFKYLTMPPGALIAFKT